MTLGLSIEYAASSAHTVTLHALRSNGADAVTDNGSVAPGPAKDLESLHLEPDVKNSESAADTGR